MFFYPCYLSLQAITCWHLWSNDNHLLAYKRFTLVSKDFYFQYIYIVILAKTFLPTIIVVILIIIRIGGKLSFDFFPFNSFLVFVQQLQLIVLNKKSICFFFCFFECLLKKDLFSYFFTNKNEKYLLLSFTSSSIIFC